MTRQVLPETEGKPRTVIFEAGRRFALLLAACLTLVLSTSFSADEVVRFGRHDPAAAVVDPEVAAFYRANPDIRLWSQNGRPTPVAFRVMGSLGQARAHGLDETRYLTPLLLRRWKEVEIGRSGRAAPESLDPLLSSAFVRFVQDLKRPPSNLHVVDPEAAGAAGSAEMILNATAQAKGETGGAALLDMSPEYEALVSALAQWRRLWKDLPREPLSRGAAVHPGERDDRIPGLRLRLGVGTPAGPPDAMDEALTVRLVEFKAWHGLASTRVLDDRTVAALNQPNEHFEKAILADLDQLRVLPPRPDRRALVVDIAAAELRALENGREVRRMRVVVGRPETPTPSMVGKIQYAVLTPYWNLPHDLVRDRIAPEVLRRGPSVLEDRRMEALSDWSPRPQRLEADDIDWAAVSSGKARLRMRQLPGAGNMMGAAKFLFPNTLGIYLHDTPDKELLEQKERWFSAGCVRVEDAAWLARWLMGRDLADVRTGEPEQKAALADPVPVYLLYLTVKLRRNGGLAFGPDPYEHLRMTLRPSGRAVLLGA